VKVIFLEDVPNVARAGETKLVADGYGRNYLLPRQLAILAGSRAAAIVAVRLRKRERLQAQTEAEMAALAAKLNGIEVTLRAKAGAKDRLYGSVTSADIAEVLSRSVGGVVDKKKVELAQPIHQLGSYEVTVRFTHDIVAAVKLTVVAEAPEAEAKVEEKKAEPEPVGEAVAEGKAEKKKKAKAEKKPEAKEAEKAEEKKPKAKKAKEPKVEAEKKEKKTRAKRGGKAEEGETKVPKKGRAKKKVEEAGEKDAEPGQ